MPRAFSALLPWFAYWPLATRFDFTTADTFRCVRGSVMQSFPNPPCLSLVLGPCSAVCARKSVAPTCDFRRCPQSSLPPHPSGSRFCPNRTRSSLDNDPFMYSGICISWSEDNACQLLGIIVHTGLQRGRWGAWPLVSPQRAERSGIFRCEGWYHACPLYVPVSDRPTES